MRASAPFSKAVFELAHNASSRIPHLRHHILSRQSRPSVGSSHPGLRYEQRQCLHASSLRPSASVNFTAPALEKGQDAQLSTNEYFEEPTSESAPPSDVSSTSVSEIEDILQERHPDRVLFTLLDPTFGRDFIQHAQPSAFADAFTSIDPQYFVEPMKDVYRFMKPSISNDPTYRWVRRLEERFIMFKVHLNTIINIRRDSGHKLTLEVCRHFLDCARIMGDSEMAKHVMWRLMRSDEVVPDLHCYNYYMEACCWNHAWSKSEQWRLRVTPRILSIRAKHNRPADLKGHRVGKSAGLRYEMLALFKKLVADGHKGNEETFTTLMVAMGRENDLSGAKSILRSVYNINVDLLTQLDEEEVETPTYYEDDSPLRPSARLLFTVAHVFGSNNEVALASKLVDYISRQYNLQIPFDVWFHLFEWTLVLQLKRSASERKQGLALGQVGPATLQQLWDDMTDAPHNIIPDLVMRTLRARARRDALQFEDTVSDLRIARDELEINRRNLHLLSEELLSWLQSHTIELREGTKLSVEWYNLRRRFILESLRVDRDLTLLATALRQVFSEFHWPQYTPTDINEEPDKERRRELQKAWDDGYHSRALEWERCRLPSLMEEFAEYLPNRLTYKVTGGYVGINGGKAHRNALIRTLWGDQLRRTGIMRAALDTEDYDKMLEGMRQLPALLAEANHFCFICEMMGHTTNDCPKKDRKSSDPENTVIRRAGSDRAMTKMREFRRIPTR